MLGDDQLGKLATPTTVNGRQLAWMLRRVFDVDAAQMNVAIEGEVHALKLQKDNAPGISLSWMHCSWKSTSHLPHWNAFLRRRWTRATN